MKSMNIISGMAILLAAMATPLLGGCAAEVDSGDATAADAVASNDTATPADAEKTGTDQQALCGGGYGGYGLGVGCGGFGGYGLGVGCGGYGGYGLGLGGGCGGFGYGLGGYGLGLGLGCGGIGGYGLGCGGIGGYGLGLGGCGGIGGYGLGIGGFGCGGY